MKDNRGYSLVELMVSVIILSIVMAGVASVMVSMSKTFSDSQREVSLQDNVQSTYNIISEIVKEANSNSSESAIKQDDNKTYIYAENTTDNTLSKAYLILQEADRLYLYQSTPDNIKKMSLGDKENHLLATKVSDFSINTDTMEDDGYVIMKLECKNGTREADIVQNVYLRNSNKSAEWQSSNNTNPNDPFENDYVIVKLTHANTCKIDPFNVGTTAKAKDFNIEAEWVKKDNKDDKITAYVPAKYLTCPDFDKPIDDEGAKEFKINVNTNSIIASPELREGDTTPLFPETVTVTVIKSVSKTPKPSKQNSNMADPTIEKIPDDTDLNEDLRNSLDKVRVFYETGNYSGTPKEYNLSSPIVVTKKECPKCHSSVTLIGLNGGVNRYYCNDDYGTSCQNKWDKSWGAISENDFSSSSVSKITAYQGKDGKITFRNEDENSIAGVIIYLYLEGDDAYFIPVSGSDYLIAHSSSEGSGLVKYETSSAVLGERVKYIKLILPSLSAAKDDESGNKVYDSYTFQYAWENSKQSGPAVVTYVIEQN